MSILHQNATVHSLGSAATHPPRMKSIGCTVLGIIKMQTDRHTHRFLPLLERRICSAPPSEASNIQCWLLLPKLRSSKNGIRTSPSDLDMFLWDSLWNLTVQVCNFCTASKTKLNYRTAAVAKPVQPIAQPKNCWCPDISMLLNG